MRSVDLRNQCGSNRHTITCARLFNWRLRPKSAHNRAKTRAIPNTSPKFVSSGPTLAEVGSNVGHFVANIGRISMCQSWADSVGRLFRRNVAGRPMPKLHRWRVGAQLPNALDEYVAFVNNRSGTTPTQTLGISAGIRQHGPNPEVGRIWVIFRRRPVKFGRNRPRSGSEGRRAGG